jgi:hypothetical protein
VAAAADVNVNEVVLGTEATVTVVGRFEVTPEFRTPFDCRPTVIRLLNESTVPDTRGAVKLLLKVRARVLIATRIVPAGIPVPETV